MTKYKLAVAMSVYKTDDIDHLRIAITSILNQTYKNFDLYVEVDGIISKNVKELLTEFDFHNNIFIHFNQSNMGLAYRLNDIIDKVIKQDCYSFIARMDADDVSHPERFKKQVKFLCDNSDVSVVGSDVIEISETGDTLFYKKMDTAHNILASRIIKKCPFNHPSVMFNMSVFREGSRYKPELKNTQDYYLWVDLLAAGKKFANINEPLLKFRVNNSFHSRRGFKKAMNDFRSRIYAFKHLNVLSIDNVIHTFFLFLLRISPRFIKKLAYKFLR